MRFRLLHGTHIQENPDGLSNLHIKELRERALKQHGLENANNLSKVELVRALRGDEPDELQHFADRENRIFPVFEENNPIAISMLKQDRQKFECLEGEVPNLDMLGPITQEEIARRGLAAAEQRSRTDQLESQTIDELRELAAREEIELLGADGKPLTKKADIIAAIRATVNNPARM